VTGFERFGLLLNKLYELLPDISVTRTETQLALMPVDDVPVVTMDQPLRQPVIAPVPAPVAEVKPAPVAEVERYLPNEHVIPLFEAAHRELTLLGGVEAVLDKFPAEVINEFNTLITLSGEQRISVCLLRPQRLFVRSQLHLTTTGVLVLAWRQASFKRSANGQRQRLMMSSLPTLHYRVGSVKQRLHIVSALAKNIT
jgi:hypothetical protein